MLKATVFLLLCCFASLTLADDHWSHDELYHLVSELSPEQSVEPTALLPLLDEYINVAKQKNWPNIEVLAVSQKANIYLILQQFEQANQLVEQSLPIAQRLGDNKSQLILLAVLLAIYDNQADQTKAQQVREQYQAKALASQDNREIANMYISLAQSLQFYGELKQPLLYLQQALTLFEQLNDVTGKGTVLNEIAILYDELNEPQQAIEYYQRALAIHESRGNSYTLSVLYFNMGQTYYSLKENDLSRQMLNLALKMSEELQDEVGEGYAHRYLGKLDFDQGLFIRAQQHFVKALDIFSRHSATRMHFITSLNFAQVLLESKDFLQARGILAAQAQRVSEFDRPQFSVDYYQLVYQLEKRQDHLAEALVALEKVSELKLQIYDKEKADSLQELMLKFDISQTEADNKLLQQQNELKQLRLNEQASDKTIFILAFSFAIFIGLLISVFLFKQIQHRNRFKEMAMRDELTGAPNRRAILALAEKKFEQCLEDGSKLTFAMLDIDHFKNFNDSFGHDVGDKVLKIFSDACRDSLRSHDRYGRYGGEEWLLVLMDAKTEHIAVIFNRLKARLKSIDINGGPSNINLTFSLGAAQLSNADHNFKAVIKRADKNLYQAKAQGRDRYVINE